MYLLNNMHVSAVVNEKLSYVRAPVSYSCNQGCAAEFNGIGIVAFSHQIVHIRTAQ